AIPAGVPGGMGAEHPRVEWRESRLQQCHGPHVRPLRHDRGPATPELQAGRSDSKIPQQPREGHLSRSCKQPAARQHPCHHDCPQPSEISVDIQQYALRLYPGWHWLTHQRDLP
ncbi:unnamed protein product, partial [Closterium sp. Naga37s-1]